MPRKSSFAGHRRGGSVFSLAALLAALAGLCWGCSGGGGEETRVPSPDDDYTLVATVNRSKADMATYKCIKLTVVDGSGGVILRKQTRASDRMRWQVGWGPNDRIWITSSDVGVLCWDRQRDGSWLPVRGGYKGNLRYGKWEWLNDDGSVRKVQWFLNDAEVTEDEFIESLLGSENRDR